MAGAAVRAQPHAVELRRPADAVFVVEFDPKAGRFWNDGWDGYPAERSRLLAAISETKLRNPVILGGDVHSNRVCDVKRDFDNPRSPVTASEFCGTAINSLNGWDVARAARIAERNSHVRFADVEHRGYVPGDVDENRLQVQLRVIDDARQRTPGISTLAKFKVDEGRPGPIRVPA